MFSPSQFGANAYARVGAQTATFGASPQRLAIMMFEASRTAIVQCRMHMRAGRMAEKGAAVSKAVMIIGGGLKESLDMDNGGQVAERLAGHYDAMLEMLTRANLRNDEPLFDEVDRMLKALEDVWRSAPAANPAASAMTAQAVGA
ncbi:flagellar export chaperone FliS [Robbsia sp. Bb-Pol-6]|uniref:Flagellar secretion chaperone FliS n=1 Tax=Robbsia betulipollinis TaxID=2981849 RepID=A0ABT3ZJ28_9BURK|nr:flagellar export chaperone FliS [Robbsia betulipollinis]MCY0385970.1 flagellar export chaperone FliS [Robbsia betulipollinis]